MLLNVKNNPHKLKNGENGASVFLSYLYLIILIHAFNEDMHIKRLDGFEYVSDH